MSVYCAGVCEFHIECLLDQFGQYKWYMRSPNYNLTSPFGDSAGVTSASLGRDNCFCFIQIFLYKEKKEEYLLSYGL